MKKFPIAILLLLTAAFSFGQAPKAASYSTISDMYVGYVVNLPDYSGIGLTTHNLQGYELAYTLNYNPRWGLTVSGGQTFRRVAPDADQWQLTAGPRINFLTGRFRPYGTAQVGFSNQDSNQFHIGNASQKNISPANALTFRFGVGADYHLTERLYWRIGQWAAQPVFWGRHDTSLFQNFSSGLGFKF